MANQAEGRQIGPIGSVERICVGIGLLVAGVGSDPTALEFAAGFVLLPAAELVALLLIRPAKSAAFHLYGPIGYAVNFGAGGALFVLWTTPALFFYGASILLAAARGYAGCEILALSNFIRRRDDQLACAVFSPVDAFEQATFSPR